MYVLHLIRTDLVLNNCLNVYLRVFSALVPYALASRRLHGQQWAGGSTWTWTANLKWSASWARVVVRLRVKFIHSGDTETMLESGWLLIRSKTSSISWIGASVPNVASCGDDKVVSWQGSKHHNFARHSTNKLTQRSQTGTSTLPHNTFPSHHRSKGHFRGEAIREDWGVWTWRLTSKVYPLIKHGFYANLVQESSQRIQEWTRRAMSYCGSFETLL